MRPSLLLALAAGLVAAPASAQDARPSVPTPVVAPAHAGEALRVTTADTLTPEPGRLARRYKGLRANRTVVATGTVRRARVVSPLVRAARGTYVRRAGTYFPVVPSR